MGRNVLLVFISSLLFISCSTTGGQKKDCDRFKTGKFVYRKNIADSALFLTRNDFVQTETDVEKTFIRTDRITWISPCEYELHFISREPEYPPEFSEEQKSFYHSLRQKKMVTKIIKTGKDYCVFESRKEGISFVYTDTMWVFK